MSVIGFRDVCHTKIMVPLFSDEFCLRVKINFKVRHRSRVWHLGLIVSVGVRRVGMLYFSQCFTSL